MGSRVSAFLADACALIDFYSGASSFPTDLRALFEQRAPRVAVAATTAWEIAIKTALGKLVDIRDPEFGSLAEMLSAEGYVLLPFDHATAEQAARLPLRHKDPFDRALVATAQRTGRTVLTWDPSIALYGKGEMGIVCLYAGLFDERIKLVVLSDPPGSHWQAPALLNVLRVTDIPEIAGAFAPRPIVSPPRLATAAAAAVHPPPRLDEDPHLLLFPTELQAPHPQPLHAEQLVQYRSDAHRRTPPFSFAQESLAPWRCASSSLPRTYETILAPATARAGLVRPRNPGLRDHDSVHGR